MIELNAAPSSRSAFAAKSPGDSVSDAKDAGKTCGAWSRQFTCERTGRQLALIPAIDHYNLAPGNRISMGFIGTGRQVFYANLPWHLWSDEVQVVAVCDVDSWRMEKAKAKVEGQGEFPKDNLRDVLQKFQVRYRYANGIEVNYTNAGRAFVRVEGTEGWIENTWFKPDGFIASDKALLQWKPNPNDQANQLLTRPQRSPWKVEG